MTTLMLSLALALVSAVAGIEFWDARQARQRIKEALLAREIDAKIAEDAHKSAIATLNEELEKMRTRSLIAERRAQFEEAPAAGVMKARSASSIRAMNDRYNEQVLADELARQANTSLR